MDIKICKHCKRAITLDDGRCAICGLTPKQAEVLNRQKQLADTLEVTISDLSAAIKSAASQGQHLVK